MVIILFKGFGVGIKIYMIKCIYMFGLVFFLDVFELKLYIERLIGRKVNLF